jgi:hypothetical protein
MMEAAAAANSFMRLSIQTAETRLKGTLRIKRRMKVNRNKPRCKSSLSQGTKTVQGNTSRIMQRNK